MKSIEIIRVNYLKGPNIWTYRPCIEAWLDIGELEDFPSNKIPGFYERLTTYLPTLVEHKCSPGVKGGFLQRLKEGTYCAHIAEHVSLELQSLAKSRTTFGKARETSTRGVYKVVFRSYHEKVGRLALSTAIDLIMACINNTFFDLPAAQAKLSSLVDHYCLGPSTAHCVEAALDRGIPYLRLTEGNLVQLGFGNRQRRIWTAETDQTSAIAEDIASNKDMTKTLLSNCGVPVPQGCVVHSEQEAWEEAQVIGVPVVIKPLDANHGRGVSLDLRTENKVKTAFHLACERGDTTDIIVEQFIAGNEHRLLVVGNKMIAAAAGHANFVIADGVSTVRHLVNEQINSDPTRGTTEDHPLNIINLDTEVEVLLTLEQAGLKPDSIPAAGRSILIQRNGNVQRDVTELIHPSIAQTAVLAVQALGLDIAGMDMVIEDISKPIDQQSCAVIEVNSGPGLLMHIKPSEGNGQPVGRSIINLLFEKDCDGRIPIIGICGQQQTDTIAHLLSWIVHISGNCTGFACQNGIYIDNHCVLPRPPSWEESKNLLVNRSIQVAIFENSGLSILQNGLVYDQCSIGIITDLGWTPDWLTHDIPKNDAFKVTRTQADVISKTGVLILNADDPQLEEMAELCDGDVVRYSQIHSPNQIKGHRKICMESDSIQFIHENKIIFSIEKSIIGTTFDHMMGALLASIAAAWSMAIGFEFIVAGLQTYKPNTLKTI